MLFPISNWPRFLLNSRCKWELRDVHIFVVSVKSISYTALSLSVYIYSYAGKLGGKIDISKGTIDGLKNLDVDEAKGTLNGYKIWDPKNN